MKNYLEFEHDIKALEHQLEQLKDPFSQEGISEIDTNRIPEIQNEIDEKLKIIYSNLTSWQKTLVARHESRPKAKFFIDNLFTKFINLSGDRNFADDQSVIAGFAVFESQSVLVIGQEKGDDIHSRIKRNFGMMKPEGYRKCNRLMKLADKFNIPVVFFVDTPGAYPGVGAEQRGQAEAIASSIEWCMTLKVPTISFIIGEGGSGGAVALASSNKIVMLENSIYAVISPEGCASILWRDPSKSLDAAEAMKLTASDLLKHGIIDEIVPEPIGGAHRDHDNVLVKVKNSLIKNLNEFKNLTRQEIYDHRKAKFLKIGREKGFVSSIKSRDRLGTKENFPSLVVRFLIKNKNVLIIVFIFILGLFLIL